MQNIQYITMISFGTLFDFRMIVFCKINSLRRSSRALLFTCLTSICAGASYDVQKIVITGDGVPGFIEPEVTETFRYFQAVHMFPDGSVAFAGVTTRGGNSFSNKPRGIYYAGVPGVLTAIMEMEDAEANESIGLPQLMDSNDAKTFAFDSLQSTELSLQEVVSVKVFGEPVQHLTPTDESNALVSSALLPENEVYEGRFESALTELVINEVGQTLFRTFFVFKDDPDTPVQGLFQADSETGVRNIAFAGDPVPGIADATFVEFSRIGLGEDGTAFFSARMTGDGAPSTSNQALWMEKEGAFTLVLREGSAAPGFDNFSVQLPIGTLLYLDIQDNRTIVASGVGTAGGDTIFAYWIGSSTGPELTPMLLLDPFPNLNDPGIFTTTDQGNVAFSFINNNSIQLDTLGDIYFDGGGKFADGTDVGGIWKRSDIDGSISLMVLWDFTSGLSKFALLDVSDQGDLLFLAENQGVKGIWVRDLDGALSNVVNVGDMLEGREVVALIFLSDGVGLSTLGFHRYHHLMSSAGNFVFVAQFEDTDGDNIRDEGIFVAGTIPDPTDMFIWSGDAGDDDWHKPLNWDDKETEDDALISPGDAEGTETVEIPQADVTVTDSPVHIKSITASGSLVVAQPFTIEELSTIEDLVLDSDLTIRDNLLLLGEPELKQGTITGEGMLDFEEAANGSWLSLAQGGADMHDIRVHMNVFGTLNHDENVVVDFQEGGFLFIKEGGTYKANSGKIAYSNNNILNSMASAGTIEVSGVNGSDPFTIESFLLNSGGTIDVVSGELLLNNETDFEGGELKVGSGARLVFGNPVKEPLLSPGSTVTEDFVGSGDGTILFKGNKLHIIEEKTATFNMSLTSGGLEVEDGAEIAGEGTLVNEGRMVFREGILTSKLENEGTLSVTGGSSEVTNLSLTDTHLVNRQLVLQDKAITLRRTDDMNPPIAITNQGTWSLEDGAEIVSSEGDAMFFNSPNGVLKKETFVAPDPKKPDNATSRMRAPFENKGLVWVKKGKLIFDQRTVWDSGTIGIGARTMRIESGAILTRVKFWD
jgi:hypothetical protein